MTRFPVQGIRSVDLTVPDLGAAVAFYTEVWGLTLAEEAAGKAWLRGTGPDPHLLALHAGAASTILSMTYRAAPDTDLGAVSARLAALGCTPLGAPHAPDEPGGGTAIAARDTVGRTIRIVQGDTVLAPLAFDPDRAERLAHVNFNSDDVARDTRLFTDGLGFQLTDRSKMMAFVRTNNDHHSVVIADAAVNTLNHVAFQLPGWRG